MRKAYILFVLIFFGCSTQKDKALNRAYHSTTSKFNPLYNGEESLRLGVNALIESRKDNYWNLIEVYPYSLPIAFTENNKNAFFDTSEEKAVFTVQKHSMYIDGTEKNKQISRAYLLLGKSRYFNGKYLQALDAFNYVIRNMSSSKNSKIAELWKAKVFIEIGQNNRAIKELKNILSSDVLDGRDYSTAKAALAKAYINKNDFENATNPLNEAFLNEKSITYKSRFGFLLGQVYNKLNNFDSAAITYQKVIDLNRKIPRELWLRSKLEKLNTNFYSIEEIENQFKKLLKSDEDRRFRDQINYFYSKFKLSLGDTLASEKHLKKSLETLTQDKYLKSNIYELFAENRMNQIDFVEAGKYFDSTLQNLDEKSLKFRKLKRKKEKLTDIIKYEKTINKADSIILLMKKSPEEQVKHIESYISNLKKSLNKKNSSKVPRKNIALNTFESFYFYNSKQVEDGIQKFKRIWGNIELKDNWKYEKNIRNSVVELSNEKKVEDSNPLFDVKKYLSSIPPISKIDSIQNIKNEALFLSGISYKEQFNALKTSTNKFYTLLEEKNNETFLAATYYHLVKIFKLLNEKEKELRFSSLLIKDHGKSDYALMITNPEILSKNEKEKEKVFEEASKAFESQNYNYVLNKSEEQMKVLSDYKLKSQWMLLRAKAIGRLEGLPAFRSSLEQLNKNYPNTTASEKAKELLDNFTVFDPISDGETKAKIVFFRNPSDKEKTYSYKKWLENFFKELGVSDRLKASVDLFNKNLDALVIHGFISINSAYETVKLIEENNLRLLTEEKIVVLASNYRNALISKELEQLTLK